MPRNPSRGPSRAASTRSPSPALPTILLFAVPLLTLLSWAAPGAVMAQVQPGESADAGDVPFHGIVVDTESGAPVEGVSVYLPAHRIGFLTREDGRFRIPDIPVGELEVEVQRIGYTDVTLWMDLEVPSHPVRIELLPNPVMLEGFEVVVDRFERRRRATATSIRVLDESQLLTSPALDAADLVVRRGGVRIGRCPGFMRESWCSTTRGRPTPVQVYIDEAPAIGGMAQLAMYQPYEFYMVEVYGGGRHIRAYTHRFMEWAAGARLTPIPIF
jgi:hypothetical protein